MITPVTYIKDFIPEPNKVFNELWDSLAWVRHGNTPRKEYYCNDFNHDYTYGKGAGVRTYNAQPYTGAINEIRRLVESATATKFETVFLNGYENARDHLGWHADDSPEMDDSRPIAIISLGAEREIWFAPQDKVKDSACVEKQLLENGSLCLMHAGMQESHFHRIPKAGFECGPRISLTFRGYLRNKQ